ncbi:MAG: peptidyl-prolyl cis-trans isomerase [Agathobacter sp.]|nr:peptidyl-prolyl cis-trans isomerase [Agathobacter sp.]
MKIRKIMIGCLAFAAVASFTGCQVGKTRFVWHEEKKISRKHLFSMNNVTCDLKQAKIYLCNYRNLYGNAYGIDLWQYDFGEGTLEQYVKDVTIQQLSRIVCMNLLAEQMNIGLTEEELNLVSDAAKEYYRSLRDEELAYMEVRESDIATAYRQYALAKKLYDILTEGIDEEVSDDEARVISVQQIFVTDPADVEKIEEKLEAGDPFMAVASAYSLADEIELYVARDEFPQEVENIAFNLDNGAVSECIKAGEGYYFIKCISKLEEEQTEANKDNIRMKRRIAQFDKVYQDFMESTEFELNTEMWESVRLEDLRGVETDSFFEVYAKYFK